jgi:hypothetical protein
MRRLAIAAAVVVAAILILILLLPDYLLKGTYLREKLQKGPDEFFFDYASASSPSPGVVHIRGLILRDRDRATEWAFQADEVRLRYSVLALARRRVQILEVKGSGLSFRARSRPKPGAKKPDAQHLPAIPGFGPEPPPRETGPRPPKKGSPWTMDVGGIDLPLREIWVNHVRWSGVGNLTGGFELKPGRTAGIGPAVVDIADGILHDEGVTILTATKGKIEGAFPSFAVKEYPGSEVLKIVEGRIQLGGRLSGLRFLSDAFPGGQLRGGAGTAQVDLRLEKGKGSGTLNFDSNGIQLSARKSEIRGSLEGRLRLRDVEIGEKRAVLSGSRVELKDVVVVGSPTKTPWVAALNLPEARYRSGPPQLTARVEGTMSNARPLLALAAGVPEWAAKRLSKDPLQLEVRGSAGGGAFELQEAKATADDLSIEGRFRGRKGQEQGIFLVDTGLLNLGIAVGGEDPGVKVFGPKKWYQKAVAAWDAQLPDPSKSPRPATAR